MADPEAFYTPDGDSFVSSPATRGPWDPRAQHGGPPIALAATVIERRHPRVDVQVARVTAEFLRPIPVAPLTIRTEVIRPGRSVELIGGSVFAGTDEVLRLSVVRIRTTAPLDFTANADREAMPAGLDTAYAPDFFPVTIDVGYHSAMEFRFLKGNFMEQGPAAAWGRTRIPLIAGDTTSPLARVLIVADSANGISGELDYRRWVFINPELTVHLHRLPVGEWVCLDARTIVQRHGIGLSESKLFDRDGLLGVGHQSLFVAPRP